MELLDRYVVVLFWLVNTKQNHWSWTIDLTSVITEYSSDIWWKSEVAPQLLLWRAYLEPSAFLKRLNINWQQYFCFTNIIPLLPSPALVFFNRSHLLVETGPAPVWAAEHNILLTTRTEAILMGFNPKFGHLQPRSSMSVKPRSQNGGRKWPGCKFY